MGNFIGKEEEDKKVTSDALLCYFVNSTKKTPKNNTYDTDLFVSSITPEMSERYTELELFKPKSNLMNKYLSDNSTDLCSTEFERILEAIKEKQYKINKVPKDDNDMAVFVSNIGNANLNEDEENLRKLRNLSKDLIGNINTQFGGDNNEEFNRIKNELFGGGSDDGDIFSSDNFDNDDDDDDDFINSDNGSSESINLGSEYGKTTPDINVNGIFNTSDTSTVMHSKLH